MRAAGSWVILLHCCPKKDVHYSASANTDEYGEQDLRLRGFGDARNSASDGEHRCRDSAKNCAADSQEQKVEKCAVEECDEVHGYITCKVGILN